MDLPKVPRTDMQHPSFCHPLRKRPIDLQWRGTMYTNRLYTVLSFIASKVLDKELACYVSKCLAK